MAAQRGADVQLDALIDKRSESAHREREVRYACSVRAYYEREQRTILEERRAYHLNQASSLERTMLSLVQDHRDKAERISIMLEGKIPLPPIDLAMRAGRAEVL